MRSAGDPVGTGLVTSLANPGGNVTGFSFLYPEIFAKGVALLLELLPGLQRIGVLLDATNPRTSTQRGVLERACRSMGTELVVVEVGSVSELKTAVGEVARRGQALVLVPDPLVTDGDNNFEIARAALNHSLPTLGNWKEEAEAGALLWFDFSLTELRRRGAASIDKIPRGARPADLPVEQPTQFETGINLRAAKALGITVPQSLLLRADALIR
jgi:putative ABC transport system substrate-binding protein